MTLPVLSLGFRLFFLGAAVYSVISIGLWLMVYNFGLSINLNSLSASQWHAHEMIYGYSLAVIAGFLLTAVKNWTGIQTIRDIPLLMLFSLWAVARVLWLFGSQFLLLAAIADILFVLILIICVSYPVIKVKQWRQLAILPKLILLAAFNIIFYLDVLNITQQGKFLGIYAGLYLIIGLVLTMGRRVLPMFIENGVRYLGKKVKLFNSVWLDMSSLMLFLGFFICELFLPNQVLSAYLTLALFVVNAIRLICWYTPEIWSRSLLWSLYLSFWFICIGFLLFSGVYFLGLSKFIAIHAFAVGGIGVVTMAMMSRVSIGHSGRDINNPPKSISIAFAMLVTGALCRIFGPMISAQHYTFWIGLSQFLWVLSFLLFLYVFLPVLLMPRLDGRVD